MASCLSAGRSHLIVSSLQMLRPAEVTSRHRPGSPSSFQHRRQVKLSSSSVGIDLKELRVKCLLPVRAYGENEINVEMFEILPRDWNLKPIFTQKRAPVNMNWGVQPSPQSLAIPTLPPVTVRTCWMAFILSEMSSSNQITRQLTNVLSHAHTTLFQWQVLLLPVLVYILYSLPVPASLRVLDLHYDQFKCALKTALGVRVPGCQKLQMAT